MNDELIVSEMFARHVGKDGSGYVECHRVWDGERFFASQLKAAKAAGGSVELASEADYRTYKGYKS